MGWAIPTCDILQGIPLLCNPEYLICFYLKAD